MVRRELFGSSAGLGALLFLVFAGCRPSPSHGGGAADAAMSSSGDGSDPSAQDGGDNLPGGSSSEPDLAVVQEGCGLTTCELFGASCGPIGDGCGGVLQCGTCSGNQTCGGGGVAFICGGVVCVPKTCDSLGFDCGVAGDGCGGVLNCGTCNSGICGGGGHANICGGDLHGVSQCDAGATTISGKVVAGTDSTLGFGNPDPIYNATVYVPDGALGAITTGATCEQCASSQAALARTTTGIDGTFVLHSPPSGPNVQVVIELGKWRRVLSVNVTPCVDNALPLSSTHLPRNRSQGNIPRFAISTGNVDVLECVLRKMGIADSEFVNPALNGGGLPTAAGRIHVYQAHPTQHLDKAKGGAVVDNSTPSETTLWGRQATLNAYDAVLFPCVGGQSDQQAADQARVIQYANLGGRVFTTHYSYVWLYNAAPFSSTATWDINHNSYMQQFTGVVDQTFAKGVALASWLQQPSVAASTMLGKIPVDVVRNDFSAVTVGAPAQRWLYTQAPPDAAAFPIHYTFNTPVGAAANAQCGRVVFSDFHVENVTSSLNQVFPAECSAGPLTPQEKLLEFMLFDLTSCVSPDLPPAPMCTKQTCNQISATCGTQSDGCGGSMNCGTCPMGQTCLNNQCVPACPPKTCNDLHAECGTIGDGCGGTIECGNCLLGLHCGGGAEANRCGIIN